MTRCLSQPALYGIRRKSSAFPSALPHVSSVLNIEEETSQGVSGQRNSISPVEKLTNRRKFSGVGRRDSAAVPQLSTISPLSRGFRPEEIESRDRRRNNIQLRKSLQNSIHSPYSLWPSVQNRARAPSLVQEQALLSDQNRTRTPSVFNEQVIQNRVLFSPILEEEDEEEE